MTATAKIDARAVPIDLLAGELRQRLGTDAVTTQATADGIPTFWIVRESAPGKLRVRGRRKPRNSLRPKPRHRVWLALREPLRTKWARWFAATGGEDRNS